MEIRTWSGERVELVEHQCGWYSIEEDGCEWGPFTDTEVASMGRAVAHDELVTA